MKEDQEYVGQIDHESCNNEPQVFCLILSPGAETLQHGDIVADKKTSYGQLLSALIKKNCPDR